MNNQSFFSLKDINSYAQIQSFQAIYCHPKNNMILFFVKEKKFIYIFILNMLTTYCKYNIEYFSWTLTPAIYWISQIVRQFDVKKRIRLSYSAAGDTVLLYEQVLYHVASRIFELFTWRWTIVARSSTGMEV